MNIECKYDEEQKIRKNQENDFALKHRNDTDRQLFDYIIKCTEALGHLPAKHEIIGYVYLKNRLGAWNRILEKAGLKEKTKKQLEKEKYQHNTALNRKNIAFHNKEIQRKTERKFKKELESPWRIQAEQDFETAHKDDTDSELLKYISELKKKPHNKVNPINTIGCLYFIKRFGSWAEMMRKVNMLNKELL